MQMKQDISTSSDMKHLLFVCIENSNRSQMAQAFATIHGAPKYIAYSAGSKPSGRINPIAIEAMKELNYDLTTHDSKSLDDIPDITFDAVVTMGCGDECPWIPARMRQDWELPDPKHMTLEELRAVRDEIEDRVMSLLATLANSSAQTHT
jgi:protein-tyrosine-phosphatase